MQSISLKVTIISEILGGVLVIISLLNLKKTSKELKRVSDEQYISDKNRLRIERYLILGIIGMSIVSLMSLIIIFIR